MSTGKQFVHCPTCGEKVEWRPESKWRPFCSERCKLIDLGEWFEEKKRVPGEPHFPDGSDEFQ